MHQSRSAAVLVAIFWLALAVNATVDAQNSLDQARTLIGKNDARTAVVLLEETLATQPAQRSAAIELLRQAYAQAASEAEAAGDRIGAELFRDNLDILSRKPTRAQSQEPAPAPEKASTPVPETAPAPAPVNDEAVIPASPPTAEPDPAPASLSDAIAAPPSSPVASSAPLAAEAPLSAISESTLPPLEAEAPSLVAPPAQQAAIKTPASGSPEISVAAADAAFTAKRYAEAAQLYMALAQAKKLPENRRNHLAYCRCAEVVRRINAKPTTAAEWESIDAEIKQIRELSPGNWYAEYLRNLASERSPSRRSRPSQKVVVRGSAPEEQLIGKPTRAAGAPSSRPAPANPPTPGVSPNSASAPVAGVQAKSPATVVNQWQIRETANFRIYHVDESVAEQVAQVAERTREDQIRRWVGSGASATAAWSPRCEVYVYPNSKSFSRMTGQAEESPGFSTMGMNGGKIVNRRINVRADHSNLVVAILPHEVTHVVLADLFPTQQIPRWADEGMAVLAEPDSEQQLRAADLEKPLTAGQLFKLDELMVMDYPDGKYWGLYYAQSVSLTRFLVEQGSPAQFIQFVQGAQKNGFDSELRRIYKIEGFEDLQKRWLAYARTRSSDLTAGLATKNPEVTNR